MLRLAPLSRALVSVSVLMLAACAHRSPSRAPYQGPVIDTHVHVYDTTPARAGERDARPEAVLRMLDAERLSAAGVLAVADADDLAVTRAKNDQLIALAARANGRLFAIGSVHPRDGDAALAELERIRANGVRAIKLHPNSQRFDVGDPAVERVVARAGQLGLVLLFDAFSPFDPAQLGKFIALALKFPDARIILAHAGGIRFSELLSIAVMRKHYPGMYKQNLWIDLSGVVNLVAGSPSLREQLRYVCREIGIERVLFGSDYPLFAPAQALADVRAIGFTPEEERRVFHDNAAALFGLTAPEAAARGRRRGGEGGD